MSFSLKPQKQSPKPDKHPDSNIVAIIDLDFVKYSVAGVGETRSIIAKHKASGKEKAFDNKTDFWGRGKKVGGWLGKQNEARAEKGLPPFEKDSFEIIDVQEPEPLENVLHSAKLMVLGALDKLGTDKYEAILGEGDSFRVGLSTLMEYKGSRKDLLKPIHLQAVTDYLAETFKPKVVTGIEADDAVVMRAFGDPNAVIVGVDKDYRGQPVKFFDVNNPDEKIIEGDCFGELEYISSKKKVKGKGRIFLYWQMLAGDTSDEYKANCKSTKKYGDKKAYDALSPCGDDKEALEVVIREMKMLYPEPIEVDTWRGNKMWVDWMVVANEQFQMARMLRWEGDIMHFDHWLKEYGVEY